MTESRREMAERHVRQGREIVRRQRELVAEIKARGLDSATEAKLLVAFERSLALFEWDLETVRQEANRKAERSPSPVTEAGT